MMIRPTEEHDERGNTYNAIKNVEELKIYKSNQSNQ